MDGLPAATTLARSLLALGRARATGVLAVEAKTQATARPQRARLSFLEGVPRAIAVSPCDDETLGDILSRQGSLDAEAHGRALRAFGEPVGPVGAWLVDRGAASRNAVDTALRAQLVSRAGAVFAWHRPRLRFEAGTTNVGVPPVAAPASAANLVLEVMRGIVGKAPLGEIRRRLGDMPLHLTSFGHRLVSEADLTPEEQRMVAPLSAGAGVEVVLGAAGSSPRAIRSLYALRLLAAVRPAGSDRAAYATLLRKQRQLRRAVPARQMLDLPRGARPADGRRALRRLAGVVHPDRFSNDEPAEVRRASEEVMTALVQAERRLRHKS